VIDGEGGEDTAISEHEVNSSIAEVDANKSNHDEEMSKKTTNTTSVGRIAEDLHSTVKSKDGDIAAATPHPVTGGGEVAAELSEEDCDGNGYSNEEGKYILGYHKHLY
jgi:hypothetical protein